jgi:hypothetical protein
MLDDALIYPTEPRPDHASCTDVRQQKFHEGLRSSRIFLWAAAIHFDDAAA